MTIQDLIASVRALINDGEIEKIFPLLSKEIVAFNPAKINDLTILAGRYNQARNDYNFGLGTITKEEYETLITQVNLAILNLLEHLNDAKTNTKNATGKVLHNVPSKMALGKTTQCEVRIAYTLQDLLADFTKTDDTVIKDLREVTEVMNVSFLDLNDPPAFKITPISKNQKLEYDTFTQWLFMVKPILEGTYPLLIKVSTIESVNGVDAPRDTILNQNIQITSAIVETKPIPFTDTNIIVQAQKQDVLRATPAPDKAWQLPTQSTASSAGRAAPKVVTPPQPVVKSNKRQFTRIAAALALLFSGIGGFFLINHSVNPTNTVATKNFPIPSQPSVETDSHRLKENNGPVIAQGDLAKTKSGDTQKITGGSDNSKNGDLAQTETHTMTPGSGKDAVIGRKTTSAARKTDNVYAIKKAPSPTIKTPVLIPAPSILMSHTIYLTNKTQFKELRLFIDGEEAQRLTNAQGYVIGFQFNSQGQKHNLRFVKGDNFCLMDNVSVVTSEINITVCNLN